jgi:hypothetical protein
LCTSGTAAGTLLVLASHQRCCHLCCGCIASSIPTGGSGCCIWQLLMQPVILDCRQSFLVHVTGAHIPAHAHAACFRQGYRMLQTGLHPQILLYLRAGFTAMLSPRQQGLHLFFKLVCHIEFCEGGVDTHITAGPACWLCLRDGVEGCLCLCKLFMQELAGVGSWHDPIAFWGLFWVRKQNLCAPWLVQARCFYASLR